LRLVFLDFDGHTIAAQFGITQGGRYFMPKLAFDENYRQYGPGHLLIHAIMRDCAENGLAEYDFTGPWAEYKAKWTSSSRVHSTVTIFRKGFQGWSLHAAKFKMEAGVKDMLRPLVARRNGREHE
jgi:CelD/BcsL family acetyltransferase involved in cellulose biosynthesis